MCGPSEVARGVEEDVNWVLRLHDAASAQAERRELHELPSHAPERGDHDDFSPKIRTYDAGSAERHLSGAGSEARGSSDLAPPPKRRRE